MRRNNKKKRIFALMMILCALSVFSVFVFRDRMMPIIKTLALSRANNMTTVIINNTVNDILRSDEFTYDKLVDIEYDADGKISAVVADSVGMNLLKTQINVKIAQAISEIENSKIRVAAGTLTGSAFFTGMGPKITLRVALSCSSSVEIKNSFEYSGINQTLHKILLEVTTNVYVISMGKTATTALFTGIPIAQTVIVGDIPQIYAGANDTLWQDLIN